MKRTRVLHRIQWGAGLTLALLAVGASTANAEAVRQDPGDVREYWTDERMANALPGSELLDGIELPALPVVDDLVGAVSPQPQPRAAAVPISNPDRARLRTHGKVFFRLGSGNFVCSGTVVTAETKSLVVTAGHCVFGDGAFATNWMFVPAKDGSSEPYGRWPAVELDAPSQWRASEDIRYDVGMATLGRRNGKPIEKRVGARRIGFDQGRNVDFRAFGYPAGSPFNGQRLYLCRSPAEGPDSGPAPQPTQIDCNMTGGSSGGGWVISKGRVNSVVSYSYEPLCPILCPDPDGAKLYGPYFGSVIKQLYRSAQRR